jgi:acetyltransferase-like isoleucine patch superfamily enzyme
MLVRLYSIVLKLAGFLAAQPLILVALVCSREDGVIADASILASRIPFRLGEQTRYFFYRALLTSVGRHVTFRYGSCCQYRSARIGSNVLIGYFNTLGEVSIGDDVLTGGGVTFLSGLRQHSFDDPATPMIRSAGGRRMISIGSDVWIGSNATIGCNVGDRCVVAAGAVVVHDVPDHSLVGGNPARIIRSV